MTSEQTCPFCQPVPSEIVAGDDLCLFLQQPQRILPGSGIIVPRAHRETVFDLSREEWEATQRLLTEVKALLDERHAPQGYNVGWNVGSVGGQEVFHAHLHVIPRFADEPLAGKGIRFWLKQPNNRRPGAHGRDEM